MENIGAIQVRPAWLRGEEGMDLVLVRGSFAEEKAWACLLER